MRVMSRGTVRGGVAGRAGAGAGATALRLETE